MATKTARPVPVLKPSGISASDLPGMKSVFIKPDYVPARLPEGKVLFIKGHAIVRAPDGQLHELQVGEMLTKGDMVLTSQNGYVQIEGDPNFAARPPFESGILALPELDAALAELLSIDGPPGAGPGPDGDPGNLTPGLMVERVIEIVSASDYAFDPATLANGPIAVLSNQGLGPLSLTVGVSPHDISIGPGNTYAEDQEPPAQFIVNLSASSPSDTPVHLTVQAGSGVNLGTTGTALNPTDFKADVPTNLEVSADGGQTWAPVTNGQAIIPAGQTELLVRTPQINNDAVYEGPESFTLTASIDTPTSNSTASATAIITDDSDLPKVNPIDGTDTLPDGIQIVTPTDPTNPDVNDASGANWSVRNGNLQETDTSTSSDIAYLRISLSNIATVPFTLHVQAQDASAQLGSDYSNLEYWNGSSWVAFQSASGSASADISVPANTSAILLRTTVIGNNLAEQLEQFQLTAYTDAQTATADRVSSSVGINDDDFAPALQADQGYTFAGGTISGNVITGDAIGGKLDSDQDDGTTGLRLTSFSVNGTATPIDATTKAGTVTISNVGTLTMHDDGAYTFTPVTGYTGVVPQITYTISDALASNATIAHNTSSSSLDLSVIGLHVAATTTGGIYQENAEPTPEFKITLDSAATVALTVKLAVTATGTSPAELGTADNGTDPHDFKADVPSGLLYSSDGGLNWTAVPVSGNVVIPAGSTELLVRTPQINNDAVYEGNETFSLQVTPISPADGTTTLPAVTAASIITDAEDLPKVNPIDGTDTLPDGIQIVTPTDPTNPDVNDASGANWSVRNGNLQETDTSTSSDIAYLRISLSNIATVPFTLHVQAQDASAQLGSDYSNLEYWNGSSWVAFQSASGSASADISVPANTSAILLRTTVIGNNLAEQLEQFQLTAYTDAQTATADRVSSSVGINDDDFAPTANADTGIGAEDTTLQGNVLSGDGIGGTADTDQDVNPVDTLTITSYSIGGISHVAGTTTSVTGTLPDGSTGTIGTFVLGSDGAYTFTPVADYNGTPPVVTYTISDGTNTSNATLTLTVAPVNDPAVFPGSGSIGVDLGSVKEDAALTAAISQVATGKLVITDPDFTAGKSEAVFTPQAGTITPFGSFTLASDGSWSYVLNNNLAAIQALGEGARLTDVVAVTSADGTPTKVTITILGTNDVPVITGPLTGSVAEDATPNTVSGTLTITDIDTTDANGANQAAFVAQTGTTGQYGIFSLNGTGTWVYTLDNSLPAVQNLGQRNATDFDKLTEQFTITTADGTTRTVTVTVTGTNDAPVAVADVAAATEGTTAASSTLTGNVTPAGDGSQDHDIDGTFSVTGVAAGTVASATGPVGVAINGTYGSLLLQANGSYAYTLDNASTATNALNAGQTAQDVFSYTITDDSGATATTTLTVTVTGTNDAPIVVADVAAATESNTAATTTISGNVVAGAGADFDPDSADTFSVTGVTTGSVPLASGAVGTPLNGTYGTLVLNADGSYSYALDNTRPTTNALAAGQQVQEVFSYTVTDSHGATATTTLIVTITGTNDAPVARADQSMQLIEATASSVGTSSATGNVITGADDLRGAGFGQDTDVDSPQLFLTDISNQSGTTLNFSGSGTASIAGTYGSLQIGQDGQYTYTLDNSLTATQALTQGQAVTETFSYTINDAGNGLGLSASSTLTINIVGSNDIPFIDPNPALSQLTATVSEQGLVGGSGNIGATTASTSLTQASGHIAISDPDSLSSDITYLMRAPASSSAVRYFDQTTSTSLNVQWETDAAGHVLTGFVTTSAGRVDVLTMTLAGNFDATGHLTGLDYVATLLTPLQHASGASSLQLPDIGVTVSDQAGSVTSQVVLTVNDDSPPLTQQSNKIVLGADGGYIQQWSVVQHIGTDDAMINYTFDRQAGTISLTSTDAKVSVSGLGMATSATTLDAAHPYFFDPASHELHLLTSAGSNFTVDMDSGDYSRPLGTLSVSEPYSYLAVDFDNDPLALTASIANTVVNSSLVHVDTDSANTISGTTLNDRILGMGGDDTIFGDPITLSSTGTLIYTDTGTDTIKGGAGNDTLTGGSAGTPNHANGHTDTFVWSLADAGAVASPANDTILDFEARAASAGGDILNLKDLLGGEHGTSASLDQFLDFTFSTSAGVTSTTVHVSSAGALLGTGTGVGADQTIVLSGVDLRADLSGAPLSGDQAIIDALLQQGKLVVDP
jgi:VCBS repeat-containing protein